MKINLLVDKHIYADYGIWYWGGKTGGLVGRGRDWIGFVGRRGYGEGVEIVIWRGILWFRVFLYKEFETD